MAYQTITVSFEGSLAGICLNRPEKRNALSLACMRELIEVLDNIGRTREIRAVILAAAGKAFSSGHDLSEMIGRSVAEYRELFEVCTELMQKIQSIPQPVIAKSRESPLPRGASWWPPATWPSPRRGHLLPRPA
jgi:enoyl-CoA hydratase/carnithine racemase